MISLSKADEAPVALALPALPAVNLLPPEIMVRRRFRRVQAGLVGAVLAAALIVALLFVAASGGVSAAQGDVMAAGAQQRSVQAESARYKDVTAAYQRVADAQALLVTAMGQEVRYSRFLNDLALSIPPNVWIKTIAFTQAAPGAAAAGAATATSTTGIGSVSVTGVAFTHEDVALWLESLADEKGYAAPTLQTSTEVLLGTNKPGVNWSSTVVLTPVALSGRYTANGG